MKEATERKKQGIIVCYLTISLINPIYAKSSESTKSLISKYSLITSEEGPIKEFKPPILVNMVIQKQVMKSLSTPIRQGDVFGSYNV